MSSSQPTPQSSSGNTSGPPAPKKTLSSAPKVRKSVSSRIHEAVKAIALCHNVTPVYEPPANAETETAEADQDFSDDNRTYQASSPDEVRLWFKFFGNSNSNSGCKTKVSHCVLKVEDVII